jgi:NAD(P) transhydrogenase
LEERRLWAARAPLSSMKSVAFSLFTPADDLSSSHLRDRYDLIVIGAGPAGEKGAAQAAYFGHSVLVVEKAPEPGGAAVHTGTLPSKTLRETALYLSGHRARDLYGVSVALDDPHAAVPKLIARKDAVARQESVRIRENLRRHGVDFVRGVGRFLDPHTIEIEGDGQLLRARGEIVLIATGSTPHSPDNVPIANEREVYDSDEILGLDRLPSSLAVLGGGVIGCEYACMFAALGVAVTLVDARDRLLPFLDHEMGDRLADAMRHLEIDLRLRSPWRGVRYERTRGVVTTLEDASEIVTEKLLFAAGRVGNTQKLALDRIGLAPNKRGYIDVDASYRTAVSNVYAAGDVIGFPALASTSMEQARVAVCHAFSIAYKRSVAAMLPYGIYTIPELSSVGETEQSAGEKGIDYVVGRARYEDNARGLITGDLEGVTKILVDRSSRRVIGVHVIGERATELIHIGHAVMHLGGTVDAFIEMVFNYPTLSESYKYAAYHVLGQLAPK